MRDFRVNSGCAANGEERWRRAIRPRRVRARVLIEARDLPFAERERYAPRVRCRFGGRSASGTPGRSSRLVAALAGLIFFEVACSPRDSDPRATPRPVPARPTATSPLRDVVPIGSIPWPEGAPPEVVEAVASAFASARERRDRARDTRERTQADAELARALADAERRGLLVRELGPYHLESLASALDAGDHRRVLGRLEGWLRAFPKDVEHRLLRAKVLYELQRWRDAGDALRSLADEFPRWLEPRYWLAETSFRGGARAIALQAVEEGLRLLAFPSPLTWEHPEGRAFLGNSIKVLHRFRAYPRLAEVARYFRERDPALGEARMAEGVALVELGRYDEAIPLLEAVENESANRSEVWFALGLARSKQREWSAAARRFARLLAEDPYFERAYYQLGLCLARLGRTDDARAMFAQAESLAASEREIRRGLELEATGAIGSAAVSRSRGYALRLDFERAESTLRSASLKRDPRAVFALADLYLDALRVADARRVLDHAAALVGAEHLDVSARRALGEIARGGARGVDTLNDIASAQPGRVVWKERLARALLVDLRPADAAAVLATIDQPDGEAAFTLGRALLLAGDPRGALAALRRVSAGDKRWASWRGDLWLAWALAAGGEGDAARAEAAGLLRSVPESDRAAEVFHRARLALAQRAGEVASPDRAASTSAVESAPPIRAKIRDARRRVAQSVWPGTALAYLELARLYAAIGERREALRWASVARWAAPSSVPALSLSAELRSAATDVYFRIEALRALARVGSNERAATISSELSDLESAWLSF